MCDGSDPRWLVWGQWQAPLPQFSFLLDSVDHLTIHSFGANAKAIGTIGMIHDASGSLTSNYDAQSLRFALEALSLSLRAQMRSSMSLEVGKAVAEQRSQVLKQVQDDSYARTCFTGRLLWGPQQCRWKRVLWFIWSLSKDVQSYCFATYSNLFVAKPEVFFGAWDEFAANFWQHLSSLQGIYYRSLLYGCVAFWDISAPHDRPTGQPDAPRKLQWIFKLCRQSKMHWFHCRVSKGLYTTSDYPRLVVTGHSPDHHDLNSYSSILVDCRIFGGWIGGICRCCSHLVWAQPRETLGHDLSFSFQLLARDGRSLVRRSCWHWGIKRFSPKNSRRRRVWKEFQRSAMHTEISEMVAVQHVCFSILFHSLKACDCAWSHKNCQELQALEAMRVQAA